MKVYLLDPLFIKPSASDYERACYHGMVASAALDHYHRHETVDTADAADLILASTQGDGFGAHFRELRASTVFRAHRRKLVCYCPDDLVYAALPGIYPAATPYWAAQGWACGGHYISQHIRRHDFDPSVPAARRNFLFAFVGSSYTHPVREKLLGLRHERALLQDSMPKSSDTRWYQREPQAVEEMYARFRQGLSHTKFALCPRGASASSIRLYEAMEAGCAPVIVADDLVLPQGPDWEAFCVRVPEAEVASIPSVLETREATFAPMGALARAAWEQYFSPAATFDSLAEWGGGILRALTPVKRTRLEWQARIGEYIIPDNLRSHVRHIRRKVRAPWLTKSRRS